MDSKELKKWAIDNNIRERTIQNFWKCFENYKNEEPKEYEECFPNFDTKLLTIWFSKITLNVRNWDKFEDEYNENHEYIEAYLKLEYRNRYIGYYSLLYNFSGEVFDDFFVLE